MKTSDKIIITAALTGAVHTPTMSEHLPITAEQMVEDGMAAVAAGASILHLHARDPLTGQPDPSPDTYDTFVPELASRTDAIINITTGGSTRMTLDDRLAAARHYEPELASLNMGSMNFVFSGPAQRDRDWKFAWERDYLLGSEDVIFSNTYRQIESTLRDLGEGCGTRFEFECYDVGHLYTLAHFLETGLVKTPMLIQLVLGVLGGIGPDLDHVVHLVRTADRLFGDDYCLSAFGAGRHQLPVATQSMLLGGNVRVGLEDSLYVASGVKATGSADQVQQAVTVAHALGRAIASPADARELLQLKGADNTRIAAPAPSHR